MGQTKITIVGEQKTRPKREPKKKSLKEEKGVRVPGLKGGERVVAVGFEEPPVEKVERIEEVEKELKATSYKLKAKSQRGKRYLAARAKVDPKKAYAPEEAARLAKETSVSRFSGSVELHLVLKSEGFNTSAALPYSGGKQKRIEVATDETLEKIKEGKIDFDILLARPQMMPKLIPFAKILGPRGLLPNPKEGTLTENIEKAKDKFGGNALQIKSEKKAPLAHLVIAKATQPEGEIAANLTAVINSVGPQNIKKAVVSASMGPGIRVAV